MAGRHRQRLLDGRGGGLLRGQARGLRAEVVHHLLVQTVEADLLLRGHPPGRRRPAEPVADVLHGRPRVRAPLLQVLRGLPELELRVPGGALLCAAAEVRLQLRGAATGLLTTEERPEREARLLLPAGLGRGGAHEVPDLQGAAAVAGDLHPVAALVVHAGEGDEPGPGQWAQEGGRDAAADAAGGGDAAEVVRAVHDQLPGGGPPDDVGVARGPAEGVGLALLVPGGHGRGRGLLHGGHLRGRGGLADALTGAVRDVDQDRVVTHVADGDREGEPGLARPLLNVVRALRDHGRRLVAVDAGEGEQALPVAVAALEGEVLPLALLQAGAAEGAGEGDGGRLGGGDDGHAVLLRCGALRDPF